MLHGVANTLGWSAAPLVPLACAGGEADLAQINYGLDMDMVSPYPISPEAVRTHLDRAEGGEADQDRRGKTIEASWRARSSTITSPFGEYILPANIAYRKVCRGICNTDSSPRELNTHKALCKAFKELVATVSPQAQRVALQDLALVVDIFASQSEEAAPAMTKFVALPSAAGRFGRFEECQMIAPLRVDVGEAFIGEQYIIELVLGSLVGTSRLSKRITPGADSEFMFDSITACYFRQTLWKCKS